jgi:SAM-dependent methyltransferase
MPETDWATTNVGTGPGVITPDGCAVDFYALAPAGSEPDIVAAAAGAAPASILELGAGTGRIAEALAAMGHRVVAVDESAEMLAHIQTAETIRAQIQGLALGRRFDVVLLASFLVNATSQAIRSAFLDTCARHVSETGCVVIQQHPPAWFDSVGPSEREAGGIVSRLRGVSRPEPGLVSATAEYQVGDRVWTHSFTAMRLEHEDLRTALGSAGLVLDRYLTDDHQWVRAVPAITAVTAPGC